MGFINGYLRRVITVRQNQNLFELNFLIVYKKNVPVDGQTRWAKSSSQQDNLPGAWPFMKPLISFLQISSLD